MEARMPPPWGRQYVGVDARWMWGLRPFNPKVLP